MNTKTLEALNLSIKKWEDVRDKKVEWDDPCPLCTLDESEEDDCEACPVMIKTGKPGCKGTPYMAYNGMPGSAQREVDFLKSLLPKETK